MLFCVKSSSNKADCTPVVWPYTHHPTSMSLLTLFPILSSIWKKGTGILYFLRLLCWCINIINMKCFVNCQVLWTQVLYILLRTGEQKHCCLTSVLPFKVSVRAQNESLTLGVSLHCLSRYLTYSGQSKCLLNNKVV